MNLNWGMKKKCKEDHRTKRNLQLYAICDSWFSVKQLEVKQEFQLPLGKPWIFLSQNKCVNNLCENNATCQTGFTDKGYRCMCTTGFKEEYCEIGESLEV